MPSEQQKGRPPRSGPSTQLAAERKRRNKNSASGEHSLIEFAVSAYNADLAVLPPKEDGTKAPIAPGGSWEAFQVERAPLEQVEAWYQRSRSGLGIVCGAVSEGLVCFEFEGRAVEAGVDKEFKAAVKAAGLELLWRRVGSGYCERTPSGGWHFLYRCPESVGQRLASTADNKPLIETKGEGGFVIVAPSHGPVHESGRPWELITGGFDSIATITADEQQALLEIARTFDGRPPREHSVPFLPIEGKRPGDDFNRRGTWDEVDLEGAGWTRVGRRHDGTEYWRRPGKAVGISATLDHAGHDMLHVFSTSTPFPEADKSYRKFAAYVYLHHEGDFTAAARALVEIGYEGEPDVDADVARELYRQRVRDQATTRLRQEKAAAAFVEPPSRLTLAEDLAVEHPPLTYLVEELHPSGFNTTITARYKVGKTTLLANLLRSLLDGERFLGMYDVQKPEGRVAFWNYELTEEQCVEWLRRVGIRNPERASVWNLRGYRLPLMTPYVEDKAVRWLQEREVTCLIIDPFARAFSGGGSENANEDVASFLESLDVIKRRAGVVDLFMSVHMGRAEAVEGEERARGATRLDDWADVRWLLTKDGAVRYFKAEGRGVFVPEGALEFAPASQRLTLVGGSRKEGRWEDMIDSAVRAVANDPGIPVADLLKAMSGAKSDRSKALNETIHGRRLIRMVKEGRAHRHYLTEHGEGWFEA